MKKFTKLTLTLAVLFGILGGVSSVKATKLYATYGSPASEGSWDEETGVYSWKAGYSNLMPLFTFSKGELAEYTSINFSTDAYSGGNEYRLYFHGPNKEIAFYSSGDKSIVFADRSEFEGVDLSTVTGISFGGASGGGSIQITGKPYLEKPTTVDFNDSGIAYFDWTDISVSGDKLSYDDQTGTVTSTGTSGTIDITFDRAYDLSALTHWTAEMTGDDIVQHWQLLGAKNNGTNLDMYSGEYDRAFPGTLDDPDFTAVTGVKLHVNAAGTLTFTKGKTFLTSNVITGTPGNEVAIGTLPRKYYEGDEWKTGSVNKSYGTDIETAMGDGSSIQDEYVDIASYSELRLYITSGNPRLFVVKESGFKTSEEGYILTKDGVKKNGQWGGIQDSDHKLVKNGGYYYISVADIKAACGGEAKLIGVKAEYGQKMDISAILLVDPTSPYDYVIEGSGPLASSALLAINDENAVAINATGITAAISLPTANPNCLIAANVGMVTNTNNVIVSGVCANLELTDGHPFKAPADFIATPTAYTGRSFTVAQATTVCLPFDLTSDEAASLGKFYEYSSFDGSTLHFSLVAAPVANKPYFVIPEATSLTLSGADKTIFATPAALKVTANDVDFIGTMEATTIPASGGDYSYYAYNNGDFVKITTAAATLPAFRAYFKVLNSAISSPAPALNICFDEFETTGIKDVKNAAKSMNGYYNLNGQKVAQPTKGLYIVNGKKVVIK